MGCSSGVCGSAVRPAQGLSDSQHQDSAGHLLPTTPQKALPSWSSCWLFLLFGSKTALFLPPPPPHTQGEVGFYQNPRRCKRSLVCEPRSLRLILFQIKTCFSSELLSWGAEQEKFGRGKGAGGSEVGSSEDTPCSHFRLVSDGTE